MEVGTTSDNNGNEDLSLSTKPNVMYLQRRKPQEYHSDLKYTVVHDTIRPRA